LRSAWAAVTAKAKFSWQDFHLINFLPSYILSYVKRIIIHSSFKEAENVISKNVRTE
jgi:hypothetical protein